MEINRQYDVINATNINKKILKYNQTSVVIVIMEKRAQLFMIARKLVMRMSLKIEI